jgi:hypothetical protein
MKSLQTTVCFLLAAALVAGCSTPDEKKKDTTPHYIIYSPNGEPLNGGPLGHPTCDKALSGWFDRIDANHDSFLTKPEFLADTKAQFARMDIDKNGYLVSEELDRYREPYRQGLTPKNDNADKEKKSAHHSKNGGQDKNDKKDSPTDQASLIDPVMSADSNLDFKVTLDEFLTQSEKYFADLDADHNGQLSRDEVLTICKKADDKK